MSAAKSIWLDVLAWLKAMEVRLPTVYPTELPPESSDGFWFHVAQIEMSTRDTLSAKVQALVAGAEFPAMSDLEVWLYRRRVEWAAQLALASAQRKIEPEAPLGDLLEWLLIDSWESDGCIGLWNHAERGGTPHPENPDGLSPT